MAGFATLRRLAIIAKRRFGRFVRQVLGETLSSQWIIVFQMGKVGSMNVVTSLKQRVGITPVFHLHVLSEQQTARMRGLIEQGAETRRHAALVVAADKMRQKLTRRGKARKKIISLARDPVAQMIATTMSEFTDNNSIFEDRNIEFDAGQLPLLYKFFRERIEHEYDFIAPWFDTEIRGLFGIDIFATPFPRDYGYKIYEGLSADLLLIRTEDLNRCHREAIEKFLGISGFELLGANRAEDKGPNYARAYKKFKDSVDISDAWLEKLYSIPWVKHIYSNEEIERFRKQWKSRGKHTS